MTALANESVLVEQKRLRILVVDDHPQSRETLIMLLVKLGHWVESEGGVGTALERLRHDGFDVLLTSLWLPDATGWNLLGELRRRGDLPPRVITMSAMPMHEGCVRSRAAGGHAHLAIPYLLSELAAALGGI